MTELLNILIGGVVTGAVYALLAIGFSLVFNVTGVLNLTQGAFVTMGALTMYTMREEAHMSLLLAFLVSGGIMVALMALVVILILQPAMERLSHTNLLMLLAGFLTAFEGAALLIWGDNPYTLTPFSNGVLNVDGAFVTAQDFWVLGAAVVAVIGLWVWLMKTHSGAGLRATAQNRVAARLMGIKVHRVVLITFCISALLGVLAGAVIAPLSSLDYTSMATYLNDGLIAVTIGGLGSLFGAAVGGLALGVVEAVFTGYVSSTYGPSISLVLLLGMLVVRPQGLLGRIQGGRLDIAERIAGRHSMPVRLRPRTARVSTLTVVVLMGLLPLAMGHSGDMHAINVTGIFCLAIVGLELVTGIAGQVNLGQAGFMAVGGYTSSILIVDDHVTPILALLAGVGASGVVAFVLGLAGSRVRGMYMVIVTLAFGILVQSVASALSVTGGPSGIDNIPSFSVAGFSFGSDDRFYYLIWGLVGVALLLTFNLIRSSRGRILQAMNSDDVGARSLGLNTRRTKVAVFVISAATASIAGTLYACYFHTFSPDMVGSSVSLQLITMLVVGGVGTQAGPLIGVALLNFIPQVLQGISNYSPLIDGVLLIVFLAYLPGGLFGGIVALLRAAGGLLGLASRVPRPLAGVAAEAAGSKPARTGAQAEADAASPGDDGEVPAGAVPTPRHAAGTMPALRLDAVSKSFGGVKAVNEVSLLLPEGSIGALIGPNGAGKSTLFNLITNLYTPDSGEVQLFGRSVRGLRADAIATRGLFRTFQTSRVFEELTVLDNALVGAYRRGTHGYFSQSLWLPSVAKQERSLARTGRRVLEVVGLGQWADEPAHSLPLAAQKHLDVARALMSRAKVLIFDEPGAGMNDTETMELGSLFLAVRDMGHTILLVDHNMSLVMGVADNVTVMDAGRVIADGAPEVVQQDPAVVDAYFGTVEMAI